MASPDTTHPYLTRRSMLTLLAGGALSCALPPFLGGCRRTPAQDIANIGDAGTRAANVDAGQANAPASLSSPGTMTGSTADITAANDLAAIVKAAHIRRPEDGILLLQKGVPIEVIKQMDWDGPRDRTRLRIIAEGYRQGKIPDIYSYTLEPWRLPMALAENDPFHKKSTGDMRRALTERLATREHATRPGLIEDATQLRHISSTHQLTIIKQYCDCLEKMDWDAFGKRHYPQGFKSDEHGGIVLGDENGLLLEPADSSFEERFYDKEGFSKRLNFIVPSNVCYVHHVGLWHTHVPTDAAHPEHAASPSGLRTPLVDPRMTPTNDTSALAWQNRANPLTVHAVVTQLKEPPRALYNVDVYLRDAWQSDDNPQRELRWYNAKDVIVIDLGNYPGK